MAVEITISYNTRNHEKRVHLVKNASAPDKQSNFFFMLYDGDARVHYYIGEHPSKKYGVVFESDEPIDPTQLFYRALFRRSLERSNKLRLIHKITPDTPWPPVTDAGEKRVSLGIANTAITTVFLPRKPR